MGSNLELGSRPVDRFLVEIAEVVLQQVQNREHGTALRHRIVRDALVDLLF